MPISARRWSTRPSRVLPWLLGGVTPLTAYYVFGLQPTTNALQQLPLTARLVLAFLMVAPLGICLGMFMPLGLGTIATLSSHPREYVAWGWAVNGFASVVGSVLATMLAMTFGFRVVLVIAYALYLIAIGALRLLSRAMTPDAVIILSDVPPTAAAGPQLAGSSVSL